MRLNKQDVDDFKDKYEAESKEGLFGSSPRENAIEEDVDDFEDKDEAVIQEGLLKTSPTKK